MTLPGLILLTPRKIQYYIWLHRLGQVKMTNFVGPLYMNSTPTCPYHHIPSDRHPHVQNNSQGKALRRFFFGTTSGPRRGREAGAFERSIECLPGCAVVRILTHKFRWVNWGTIGPTFCGSVLKKYSTKSQSMYLYMYIILNLRCPVVVGA